MESQVKGSHLGNIVNTLLISFSAFALVFNYLSPSFSLFELSQKYGVDIPQLCGRTTTVATLAFFTGGLSGIQMYDHVNRQLASYVFLLLLAIGTFLVPLAPTFRLFLYFVAVVGYVVMGYWTLQVIWIMETVMMMVGRPLFFSKGVDEDEDENEAEKWSSPLWDLDSDDEGYDNYEEELVFLPSENSHEMEETYGEKSHISHDVINNLSTLLE